MNLLTQLILICLLWGQVMANLIQLRPAYEVAGSISHYLEESGNSQKTLTAKEQDLAYFRDFVGPSPIASITPRTCKDFLDERTRQGDAPATINRRASTLRDFIGWLYDQEQIRRDFSRQIKSVKIGRRAAKSLTDEEVEKLRNGGDGDKPETIARDNLIIELLLGLGLRRMEPTRININQVDMRSRVIREVWGKGDKYEDLYIESPSLYQALETYLPIRENLIGEWQEKRRVKIPATLVGRLPLLVSFQGAKSDDAESFRLSDETIRLVVKRRGGDGVHAHLLRHRFGRDVLEKTNSLLLTSELLRHSDPKLTATYYVQSDEDAKREALRKL